MPNSDKDRYLTVMVDFQAKYDKLNEQLHTYMLDIEDKKVKLLKKLQSSDEYKNYVIKCSTCSLRYKNEKSRYRRFRSVKDKSPLTFWLILLILILLFL